MRSSHSACFLGTVPAVGLVEVELQVPIHVGQRHQHVRQLDRVTRELLARAWATGAGPGAATIDSTICETYGLAKEGARHHGYTGVYHPLLAVAAGSGDVLMARLREGRAHTARGAAHFLVRRSAGSALPERADNWMRADSGL